MIATITLEQIKVYAYHGCYREEQIVGNNFTVDVTLRVDAQLAAESDDISNALNYVAVAQIVKEEMAVKSHLLENVVMRICRRIWGELSSRGLVGGTVHVRKMNPPVGVEMTSVGVLMNIGDEI